AGRFASVKNYVPRGLYSIHAVASKRPCCGLSKYGPSKTQQGCGWPIEESVMTKPSVVGFKARLRQLSKRQQFVYMAVLCERMMPNYVLYAQMSGQGNAH